MGGWADLLSGAFLVSSAAAAYEPLHTSAMLCYHVCSQQNIVPAGNLSYCLGHSLQAAAGLTLTCRLHIPHLRQEDCAAQATLPVAVAHFVFGMHRC